MTTTRTDYSTLRRNSNPVFGYVADGWDTGDVWGSAMSAAFAVCTVLDAAGESQAIDSTLGYSRGLAVPETLDALADAGDDAPWLDVTLAEAVLGGVVSVTDLANAGRVLSRYLYLAKDAGLDY